jgi:hypothetical protein
MLYNVTFPRAGPPGAARSEITSPVRSCLDLRQWHSRAKLRPGAGWWLHFVAFFLLLRLLIRLGTLQL